MSQYIPVQSGPWSEDATWGPVQGGPPGETDTALINLGHTITIDTDIKVKQITLANGGLLVADDTTPTIEVTDGIVLSRGLQPMPFRLDGATIKAPACLGAKLSGSDGFPVTYMITATDGAGIIIDDTGIYNASATLQDIKPEGCSRAYARKIGNAVRYLTMTVRIQRGHADEQKHLRDIYLWAEMPFQIIGINGSCAIKGYIESVVYDKASVGTAYHVLQITIAEGQQ